MFVQNFKILIENSKLFFKSFLKSKDVVAVIAPKWKIYFIFFFGRKVFHQGMHFTEKEKAELLAKHWFPYHEKLEKKI